MGADGSITIDGFQDAVEIGRGGFGVVYKAHQVGFERTVALKLLPVTQVDELARNRFERERMAMGALSSHPNIVTVYGAGFTDGGQPYIVMEFMARGSLADRVRARGPLPWQEATSTVIKVAGALDAAHQSGVLHRDVKPENILVSQYGEPKLGDFGIARLQGGSETRSGVITASMAHAPPEVLEGKKPSEAGDVYSLASTLFALLTGDGPFVTDEETSIVSMIGRIATAPVPDLRERGVPAEVCWAMETALAKDPAARPTAAAFGRTLQQAQRSLGVPVTDMTLVSVALPAPDAGATTIFTPAHNSGPVAPVAPAPPSPPPPTTPVGQPYISGPAGPYVGTPRKRRTGLIVGIVVVVVLLAAGVGVVLATRGGGGGSASDSTLPPGPPGAISALADVHKGVVRIQSQGDFVEPKVGKELDVTGSGSGFIVDSSGLAVTNNHVVAGAKTLQVFVDGSDTPKTARVVGRSECDDLAVIDIDGAGYPFLQWASTPAAPDSSIVSAGFPASSLTYDQAQGTISDETNLATTWAESQPVLRHDAATQQGESGGPLVDQQGAVVGVNYAENLKNGDRYAIAGDAAQTITDKLAKGNDAATIGVNGLALDKQGSQPRGVWVTSVEPNSPAAQVGLQGGDIITQVDGQDVGLGGTMDSYCKALRSADLTVPVDITVFRSASGETLDGSLGLGSQVETTPLSVTSGPPADSFQVVKDPKGAVSVEVPKDWSAIPGDTTNQLGPAIAFSKGGKDFSTDVTVPGMLFIASKNADLLAITDLTKYDTLLASTAQQFANSKCTPGTAADYNDGVFTGRFEDLTKCQGTTTTIRIIIAAAPDKSYVAVLVVQVPTDADGPAAAHIQQTFGADPKAF